HEKRPVRQHYEASSRRKANPRHLWWHADARSDDRGRGRRRRVRKRPRPAATAHALCSLKARRADDDPLQLAGWRLGRAFWETDFGLSDTARTDGINGGNRGAAASCPW